jgi:hypothetical protein
MISTLTGRKIGQVERVDKTCFGDEASRLAFTFTLEHADGTPADPPTLTTVAPSWRPGDTIPLGARALRVIGVRDHDEPPVLVVEDTPGLQM